MRFLDAHLRTRAKTSAVGEEKDNVGMENEALRVLTDLDLRSQIDSFAGEDELTIYLFSHLPFQCPPSCTPYWCELAHHHWCLARNGPRLFPNETTDFEYHDFRAFWLELSDIPFKRIPICNIYYSSEEFPNYGDLTSNEGCSSIDCSVSDPESCSLGSLSDVDYDQVRLDSNAMLEEEFIPDLIEVDGYDDDSDSDWEDDPFFKRRTTPVLEKEERDDHSQSEIKEEEAFKPLSDEARERFCRMTGLSLGKLTRVMPSRNIKGRPVRYKNKGKKPKDVGILPSYGWEDTPSDDSFIDYRKSHRSRKFVSTADAPIFYDDSSSDTTEDSDEQVDIDKITDNLASVFETFYGSVTEKGLTETLTDLFPKLRNLGLNRPTCKFFVEIFKFFCFLYNSVTNWTPLEAARNFTSWYTDIAVDLTFNGIDFIDRIISTSDEDGPEPSFIPNTMWEKLWTLTTLAAGSKHNMKFIGVIVTGITSILLAAVNMSASKDMMKTAWEIFAGRNPVTHWTDIVSLIVDFSSWLMSLIQNGFSFKGLLNTLNAEYATFLIDVDKVLAGKHLQIIPGEELGLQSVLARVKELKVKSEKYFLNDPKQPYWLRSVHSELAQYEVDLEQSIDACLEKAAPFVVLFAGASGTGKTEMSKELQYALAKAAGVDCLDDDGNISREKIQATTKTIHSRDKWDSGYRFHQIVVIDDMGNSKQISNEHNEVNRLIAMSNTVKTPTLQPGVDDKGKIPWMALLVLITANDPEVQAGCVSISKLSILRRFNFRVTPVSKAQIDSVYDDIDPSKWEVKIESATVDSRGATKWIPHMQGGFAQAALFLQEHAEKHRATQLARLAKKASGEGYCKPHGLRVDYCLRCFPEKVKPHTSMGLPVKKCLHANLISEDTAERKPTIFDIEATVSDIECEIRNKFTSLIDPTDTVLFSVRNQRTNKLEDPLLTERLDSAFARCVKDKPLDVYFEIGPSILSVVNGNTGGSVKGSVDSSSVGNDSSDSGTDVDPLSFPEQKGDDPDGWRLDNLVSDVAQPKNCVSLTDNQDEDVQPPSERQSIFRQVLSMPASRSKISSYQGPDWIPGYSRWAMLRASEMIRRRAAGLMIDISRPVIEGQGWGAATEYERDTYEETASFIDSIASLSIWQQLKFWIVGIWIRSYMLRIRRFVTNTLFSILSLQNKYYPRVISSSFVMLLCSLFTSAIPWVGNIVPFVLGGYFYALYPVLFFPLSYYLSHGATARMIHSVRTEFEKTRTRRGIAVAMAIGAIMIVVRMVIVSARKKKYESTAFRWARQEESTINVSVKSRTMGTHAFERRMERGMRHVFVGKNRVTGFMIGSYVMVIPKHIPIIGHQLKVVTPKSCTKQRVYSLTQHIQPGAYDVVDLPGDLCLVHSTALGTHSNNLFIFPESLRVLHGKASMYYFDRLDRDWDKDWDVETETFTTTGTTQIHTDQASFRGFGLKEPLDGQFRFSHGHSGSPVVSYDDKCVLGIQLASSDGFTRGWVQPVDQKLLRDGLMKFPDSAQALFGIEPTELSTLAGIPVVRGDVHEKNSMSFEKETCVETIGTVITAKNPNGYRAHPTSKVKPTVLAEFVPKGHKFDVSEKFGPPHFVTVPTWESFVNARQKLAAGTHSLPSRLASEAADAIYVDLVSHGVIPERGPLSDLEAIQGEDGNHFIDCVKANKSAGLPYMKQKKYFFEYDDEAGRPIGLTDEYKSYYLDAKKKIQAGEMIPFSFVGTLKDEVMSSAKKKSRLFYASEMIAILLMRVYFLPIFAVMKKYWLFTQIALGVDVFSEQWGELFDHLSIWSDSIVAGDYANFDLCHSVPYLYEAVSILIRLAQASSYYTHNDIVAMETLRNSLIQPFIAFDGSWLKVHGIFTSGLPGTAEISCLLNQMYFRSAYKSLTGRPCSQFRKDTRFNVLGDDHVCSVAPDIRDRFNFISIRDYFSKHGLGYTNAQKDEREFLFEELTDVEYLKRKFHPFEDKVLAPLREESLHRMMQWGVNPRKENSIDLFNNLHDECVQRLPTNGQEIWNFNLGLAENVELNGKSLKELVLSRHPQELGFL